MYGIVESLFWVSEINDVIDAGIKIKALKNCSRMSTWRMDWDKVSYETSVAEKLRGPTKASSMKYSHWKY